jgi:hypothetical protein
MSNTSVNASGEEEKHVQEEQEEEEEEEEEEEWDANDERDAIENAGREKIALQKMAERSGKAMDIPDMDTLIENERQRIKDTRKKAALKARLEAEMAALELERQKPIADKTGDNVRTDVELYVDGEVTVVPSIDYADVKALDNLFDELKLSQDDFACYADTHRLHNNLLTVNDVVWLHVERLKDVPVTVNDSTREEGPSKNISLVIPSRETLTVADFIDMFKEKREELKDPLEVGTLVFDNVVVSDTSVPLGSLVNVAGEPFHSGTQFVWAMPSSLRLYSQILVNEKKLWNTGLFGHPFAHYNDVDFKLDKNRRDKLQFKNLIATINANLPEGSIEHNTNNIDKLMVDISNVGQKIRALYVNRRMILAVSNDVDVQAREIEQNQTHASTVTSIYRSPNKDKLLDLPDKVFQEMKRHCHEDQVGMNPTLINDVLDRLVPLGFFGRSDASVLELRQKTHDQIVARGLQWHQLLRDVDMEADIKLKIWNVLVHTYYQKYASRPTIDASDVTTLRDDILSEYPDSAICSDDPSLYEAAVQEEMKTLNLEEEKRVFQEIVTDSNALRDSFFLAPAGTDLPWKTRMETKVRQYGDLPVIRLEAFTDTMQDIINLVSSTLTVVASQEPSFDLVPPFVKDWRLYVRNHRNPDNTSDSVIAEIRARNDLLPDDPRLFTFKVLEKDYLTDDKSQDLRGCRETLYGVGKTLQTTKTELSSTNKRLTRKTIGLAETNKLLKTCRQSLIELGQSSAATNEAQQALIDEHVATIAALRQRLADAVTAEGQAEAARNLAAAPPVPGVRVTATEARQAVVESSVLVHDVETKLQEQLQLVDEIPEGNTVLQQRLKQSIDDTKSIITRLKSDHAAIQRGADIVATAAAASSRTVVIEGISLTPDQRQHLLRSGVVTFNEQEWKHVDTVMNSCLHTYPSNAADALECAQYMLRMAATKEMLTASSLSPDYTTIIEQLPTEKQLRELVTLAKMAAKRPELRERVNTKIQTTLLNARAAADILSPEALATSILPLLQERLEHAAETVSAIAVTRTSAAPRSGTVEAALTRLNTKSATLGTLNNMINDLRRCDGGTCDADGHSRRQLVRLVESGLANTDITVERKKCKTRVVHDVRQPRAGDVILSKHGDKVDVKRLDRCSRKAPETLVLDGERYDALANSLTDKIVSVAPRSTVFAM